MPTARELLEQADALMRRNRADLDDDIPVLTDAVPSLAEAPATSANAAVRAAKGTSERDPVPTLTDAVLPIEAAVDRLAIEGEPSAWLEFEDAEPSVIGDAPDSIAIVPPVDTRHELDEALIQSAEHEEIELLSPVEDEFAEEFSAHPALPSEPNAPTVPTQDAIPSIVDTSGPAATESMRDEPELDHEGVGHDATDLLPVTAPEPHEPPAPELAAAVSASPVMAPIAAMVAGALPSAPAPPPVPEQEHWDAMAEEIRMQVLQRIDLFTDTGLREQLGAQLKPIVDRASADLVATINQHVGELLRTYVAQAIEREIERWRQDN